jgi:hypothetical protein
MLHICILKGPKHEIIENGIFTQIRSVKVGDLGTGKKMKFRKLESLFEGFRYENPFQRMISMRLITKKIYR